MKLIAKWIITAFSLLAVAYLFDSVVVSSIYIALVVAFVIGLLNAFIRPILIIVTLPINILTLGLFTLIINGFLFWFVTTFIEGFAVSSFGMAIVGSLVVSIFSCIGNTLLIDDKE